MWCDVCGNPACCKIQNVNIDYNTSATGFNIELCEECFDRNVKSHSSMVTFIKKMQYKYEKEKRRQNEIINIW